MKIFAMIEMLTAIIFLSLALIFFLSKNELGGEITIPLIFAFIGVCSLIAAPTLIHFAKKSDAIKSNYKNKIS
ncbi:MAG: hypothetical protein IT280_00795 [Ignavibacteria bacterium]|nr:hypothetical protein [Ignavibacteria bacterium]